MAIGVGVLTAQTAESQQVKGIVALQTSTPGVAQSGHLNVTGTGIMGSLVTPTAAISNLTGNVTIGGKLTGSGQAQFTGEIGLGTAPVTNQRVTMLVPTNTKGLVHTDGTISLATWVGGGTSAGLVGTSSNHPLGFVVNGGSPKMTITTGGRVGIGTDAPTDLFTVKTASSAYGITHTDGTILLSSYLGGGMGWLGTYSNHPLAFYANNGAAALIIDVDGTIYPQKGIISGERIHCKNVYALGDPNVAYSGRFESTLNTGIVASGGENGAGVQAYGPASSYAIDAIGRFRASGTKSFSIDHPSDPANKYLNHYCTEGPAPYNVYKGRVTTRADGYAWIELPKYYESINKDPDYQLTVVDDSDDFVQAKVTHEVENGRFQIRTSKPGVTVCWEVKATRNDPYVREYGAPVEVDKPKREQGTYQHPELYGMPPEMKVGYDRTLR